MPRFRRLAQTDLRQLTRAELLDRAGAESGYWARRGIKSDQDQADYAAYSRILHEYLNPGDGLNAARDVLEGRPNDYWEQKPAAGGREP
jgi:hypothetical protein